MLSLDNHNFQNLLFVSSWLEYPLVLGLNTLWCCNLLSISNYCTRTALITHEPISKIEPIEEANWSPLKPIETHWSQLKPIEAHFKNWANFLVVFMTTQEQEHDCLEFLLQLLNNVFGKHSCWDSCDNKWCNCVNKNIVLFSLQESNCGGPITALLIAEWFVSPKLPYIPAELLVMIIGHHNWAVS